MDIRDSQRIKQICDNTEKMADAFSRIADALERLTEPNCSEKPNNCKVKNYCDDCLYNDVCDDKEFFYACTSKSTISKMEQVDKDTNVRSKEPQKDCKKCKNYEKCKNNKWKCCVYQPIEDEPRKEQNFCGKCRYLYRDFKYGLSCYRLMDNEPCKYEERKDEPQTDCAWKKGE